MCYPAFPTSSGLSGPVAGVGGGGWGRCEGGHGAGAGVGGRLPASWPGPAQVGWPGWGMRRHLDPLHEALTEGRAVVLPLAPDAATASERSHPAEGATGTCLPQRSLTRDWAGLGGGAGGGCAEFRRGVAGAGEGEGGCRGAAWELHQKGQETGIVSGAAKGQSTGCKRLRVSRSPGAGGHGDAAWFCDQKREAGAGSVCPGLAGG